DANMMTFHRVKKFRSLKLSDSPADLYPLTVTKDIVAFDIKKAEITENEVKPSWVEKGIGSVILKAGKSVQLKDGGEGSILLNVLRPTKVNTNAINNEQFIEIELTPAD